MCEYQKLLKILSVFQGLKCWNIYSCGGGPTLRISFGKSVETQLEFKDKIIRRYKGQYELFFDCSWRLDNEDDDVIISSAQCDYDEIKTSTIFLIGDSIKSIEIISPVWDTIIHFLSGTKLNVFCDRISLNGNDASFNWYCDIYKDTYYIGPGKSIEKATRDGLVSDILYEPEEIDMSFVISDRDYHKSCE